VGTRSRRRRRRRFLRKSSRKEEASAAPKCGTNPLKHYGCSTNQEERNSKSTLMTN
jgi:hypothetical protein